MTREMALREQPLLRKPSRKGNMKSMINFSIFQVFFYSIMWTSKTLHPIFFENHHHLEFFGFSYSAMALVGYFSFALGSLSDHLSSKKVIGIGSALYAIGLMLRAFPDSALIAIMSGLVAGLGASASINALRVWMLELATEETTHKWVGIKSSTTALGTALGCLIAGLLPNYFSGDSSLQAILFCVGAILLLVSSIFAFSANKSSLITSPVRRNPPWTEFKNLFQIERRLVLFTFVIGALTGFYVSFISPYLPVIMKQRGLSIGSIGVSIGCFSLIRFFIDPLIAKSVGKRKNSMLKIFISAELIILAVTGVFALPISKDLFLLFLLFRSISLGYSTIAEELLWIQKLPKSQIGLLFGINQSAFFLGDFFGGLSNGYLYQHYGLYPCVLISVIAITINGFLFYNLFEQPSNKIQSHAKVIPC